MMNTLADVNLRADTRGNILGLKVGNDVLVSEKDLGITDIGRRIKTGDVVERADSYKLSGDHMYIAVQSGANSKIMSRLVDDVFKYKKVALMGQAKNFAKHFAPMFGWKGSTSSTTKVGMGGGASLDSKDQAFGKLANFFTGISAQVGAKLNFEGKSVENFEQNFLAWSAFRAQQDALKVATFNGKVDREVFQEQYYNNIKKLSDEIEGLIKGEDPMKYGGSAIAGYARDFIQWVGNSYKDQASFFSDPNKFVEFMQKNTEKHLNDSGIKISSEK